MGTEALTEPMKQVHASLALQGGRVWWRDFPEWRRQTVYGLAKRGILRMEFPNGASGGTHDTCVLQLTPAGRVAASVAAQRARRALSSPTNTARTEE